MSIEKALIRGLERTGYKFEDRRASRVYMSSLELAKAFSSSQKHIKIFAESFKIKLW